MNTYQCKNMPEDDFYKIQTWKLLMQNIEEIKKMQEEQGKDIQDIKTKISWIIGIATGVTFVVNIGWQWVKSKLYNS